MNEQRSSQYRQKLNTIWGQGQRNREIFCVKTETGYFMKIKW